MALEVDYTSGVGYINAGGNAITQPVCLNTRGGNVGIGLTSPTERLEVTGDVFINNPTSKLYLGVNYNYILGDANNMAIRTNGDIYIQDTKATLQNMAIKSDGKIGIRTSTPTSNLNVKGDTKLEDSLKIHCQYPTLPFESFYYKNSGNPAYANNFRF